MKEVRTECPICFKTVYLTESLPPERPTLKGHLLWTHPQIEVVEAYLKLLGEN